MKGAIVAGSVFAALGVAAGAFGAHGLKGRVDPDLWHTAVFYHLIHAVAMVAMRSRATAWWFGAGIVLFSGSLYGLALHAPSAFGMVTPVGGVAFIAGWIAAAIGARRA